MICSEAIRLAKYVDVVRVAEMSRDIIESGLGWSWTPSRVAKEIVSKDANVIVAVECNEVIGFAIMEYFDREARLHLFGVHPKYRRKGIGTRLIRWLEETALTNGNGVVYLETRLKNESARKFYKSQGYQIVQRIPGFYMGRETAVLMAHDLWSGSSQ